MLPKCLGSPINPINSNTNCRVHFALNPSAVAQAEIMFALSWIQPTVVIRPRPVWPNRTAHLRNTGDEERHRACVLLRVVCEWDTVFVVCRRSSASYASRSTDTIPRVCSKPQGTSWVRDGTPVSIVWIHKIWPSFRIVGPSSLGTSSAVHSFTTAVGYRCGVQVRL